MKFIKKLIWLIKNQEKIELLLTDKAKKSEKDYSIAGVPDFQRSYIDDLLSGKLDTKRR